MLSKNEYKVLSKIKEINDKTSKQKLDNKYEFMFKSQILNEVNIEEYELNEIMQKLNHEDYICNLFNSDDKYIHGTRLTDKGLMALKYNKKNWKEYIFKNYIWVIFTIILTAFLTAFLTAYFTCLFTE